MSINNKKNDPIAHAPLLRVKGRTGPLDMKKKKYITPKSEIVKLQTMRLLVTSDPNAIQFDGIDMDGFGGIDDGTAEPS